MSVFSVALSSMEQACCGLEEEFETLPDGSTAIDAASPNACCSCGVTPGLDKAFVVDPSLAETNACGYAVFQGIPPPAEFWKAVIAARCSAVVVLGHDERHVSCFFQSANPSDARIPLPGNRTLRCVHHVSFPEGLVVRQLEVAGPSGGGELWVNFLHLASWPDYGVPSTTAGMLRLCRELESCRRPGARIAVQCCCGTDAALGACPAGAFIAIDMLRQRLQSLQLAPLGSVPADRVGRAIDVAELVRSLREQRKGLVETARQYVFIHAALADEVREGLRVERRLMPRGVAMGVLGRAAPAAAALAAAE